MAWDLCITLTSIGFGFGFIAAGLMFRDEARYDTRTINDIIGRARIGIGAATDRVRPS